MITVLLNGPIPPPPGSAQCANRLLGRLPRRVDGERGRADTRSPLESTMSTATLPFQPSTMSEAQIAAISYLARYSVATHML